MQDFSLKKINNLTIHRANRRRGIDNIYQYGEKDQESYYDKLNPNMQTNNENTFDNQYYEQQTAVSDASHSYRNNENSPRERDERYITPIQRQISPRSRSPRYTHSNNHQNITKKASKGEELLSILVGEKPETKEQK